MSQSNDVRERVEAITDKHGQAHHPNCGLNTENGSYNVCDCYVAELVDDLANLLQQSNRESRLDELDEIRPMVDWSVVEYVDRRQAELQHPERSSDE